MTVTYHSGRRIQGTQADFDGIPAVSGGWKELGRTTLGSAGDTISVTSLPDKRYYQVLFHASPTSTANQQIKFNNSSSGYARRGSEDGGGDFTSINQTHLNFSSGSNTYDRFHNYYISNLSSKEKLLIGQVVDNSGNGAGNAPSRLEGVGKWANTSSAFNRIDFTNTNGGSAFPSGTEVVVLGWDPDDTHTSNFFEELASVNGDGTGGFDTGTFTAKKYLWVQAYLDPSTSARNNFRVGNTTVDTGNNYANRGSTNDGADATETSVTIVRGNSTSYSTPTFFNMFIINNTSNEKLLIGHSVNQNTSGAATAPSRIEFTSKWTDTSNQIDIIEAFPSSGNYNTGSFIKVWGAD